VSPFLLWLFTSGPALIFLSFAVTNLRSLRPLAPGVPLPAPKPKVSALVPARDEEAAIGACLEALVAEPFDEILVLDDESRDGTAAIVQAHAARDPRVRLLRSPGPLPAGWAGKPRACAELSKVACGEVLVFVDADVRLERGGLSGLLAARAAASADVVCALPRQELVSFAERLIVPLLHLIYFALAPLWLIPKVRSPIFTAANGQLMLVTAAAVRAFGGHAHASVRGAVSTTRSSAAPPRSTACGCSSPTGSGSRAAACTAPGPRCGRGSSRTSTSESAARRSSSSSCSLCSTGA
jgi:hypothetical protein